MPQHTRIASAELAIQRALSLTGFANTALRTTATQEKFAATHVPFLGKQMLGKTVWRVRIENFLLTLKSAIPGYNDPYMRTFTVILDEESGTLIELFSTFTGDAPDMRPEPDAADAESQLRAEGEIYVGWPEQDQPIRFVDALSSILATGIGSPFLAKEFHAACIMESIMGAPARPVWVVTLRGLPPMPARGPQADSIPAWQRNHVRNIVDALTGALVFATNSPQPKAP